MFCSLATVLPNSSVAVLCYTLLDKFVGNPANTREQEVMNDSPAVVENGGGAEAIRRSSPASPSRSEGGQPVVVHEGGAAPPVSQSR